MTTKHVHPMAALSMVGWLAAGAAVWQSAPSPGADLKPGMRLIYESGGQRTEWTVDSVVRQLRFGDQTDCVRILFRRGATPDPRQLCGRDSLFYSVNAAGAVSPSRPVVAGRSLEISPPSGGTMRYQTGAMGVDTVGTVAVRIVETTMLTTNRDGRPIRRLRERFAPGFATATWGVFEVADSTAASGWRQAQEFRIVQVLPP